MPFTGRLAPFSSVQQGCLHQRQQRGYISLIHPTESNLSLVDHASCMQAQRCSVVKLPASCLFHEEALCGGLAEFHNFCLLACSESNLNSEAVLIDAGYCFLSVENAVTVSRGSIGTDASFGSTRSGARCQVSHPLSMASSPPAAEEGVT